ncbi:MAG: Clp protease N-terminal domain-containing protein [Acidimicrobiia bacterium]
MGTEHLLLGLLDEPDGIAAQVLAELGVTDAVRDRLHEIMRSPGYNTRMPFPGRGAA